MASDAARQRALRRGPGIWGFLLAHHHPHELDRCYQFWVGPHPLWICARCAGLIPALLVGLGLQLIWAQPSGPWDVFWLGVLPWPALVDWGRARLGYSAGRNIVRSLTGLALGLSMGRSAYLHGTEPFHPWVCWQLGLLGFCWISVEILARWGRAS